MLFFVVVVVFFIQFVIVIFSATRSNVWNVSNSTKTATKKNTNSMRQYFNAKNVFQLKRSIETGKRPTNGKLNTNILRIERESVCVVMELNCVMPHIFCIFSRSHPYTNSRILNDTHTRKKERET